VTFKVNISSISDEITTLLIGAAGGIAGYFVSNGRGWKLFIASAFVGGFAAYTIPPIIAATLLYVTGEDIMGGLMNESRGVIGAISWELIRSGKESLPNFIQNLKNRLNKGSNKECKRIGGKDGIPK
jgi:hypothetical protein